MCESLIVHNDRDTILFKSFAMLLKAESAPEIVGVKGISGLWFLGRM